MDEICFLNLSTSFEEFFILYNIAMLNAKLSNHKLFDVITLAKNNVIYISLN